MNRQARHVGRILCLVVAGMFFLGGCAKMQEIFKTDRTRFLSPGKLIRPPAEGASPITPILQSVTISDQAQELVPNATFPTEGDYEYTAEDYVIGPNDILDISILDLFSVGMETTIRRQVTAGGFIDLPLLSERIRAEEHSALEMQEAIKDAYSPEILREPTVSVTVIVRRQSTFSIVGAVRGPGTYTIPRRDMRLYDAIALAGDITQVNIRYLYVIRQSRPVRVPGKEASAAETVPSAAIELPPLPEIPPATAPTQPEIPGATAPTQPEKPSTKPAAPAPEAELRELERVVPGPGPTTEPKAPPRPKGSAPATREKPKTLPAPSELPRLVEAGGATAPATTRTADMELLDASRSYKWIYSGGRWVRVAQDVPGATRPGGREPLPVRPARRAAPGEPAVTEPDDPFGWKKIDRSDRSRIIAINTTRLLSGDSRMNIIIRDNDIIYVPVLKVGEFYIMGEVNRPGVFSLTGRRITLKMALAAAGSFGGQAWPKNSLLVRRIGNNQEQRIPLDLEAIVRGEEADIFLKPDDVIAVGTDVRAPFMGVVRTAFRMTYGFGFIYDRNFADRPPSEPTSKRFTRW